VAKISTKAGQSFLTSKVDAVRVWAQVGWRSGAGGGEALKHKPGDGGGPSPFLG